LCDGHIYVLQSWQCCLHIINGNLAHILTAIVLCNFEVIKLFLRSVNNISKYQKCQFVFFTFFDKRSTNKHGQSSHYMHYRIIKKTSTISPDGCSNPRFFPGSDPLTSVPCRRVSIFQVVILRALAGYVVKWQSSQTAEQKIVG
jgi:hypothetical protein